MKERSKPVSAANIRIAEYFTGEHGRESGEAFVTGILSQITPEFNEIAASQLEKGFTGPKSWMDVNAEASKSLTDKINIILDDENNKTLFNQYPSIENALGFIKDVLVVSDDPELMFIEHSKYLEKCIMANANGEPIILIFLDSDYTNPPSSVNERTQICEALAAAIISLPKNERAEFEKLSQNLWEVLKLRANAKNVMPPNIIIGKNVMEAGFETLSSTVGEAFIFNGEKGPEHGFYLALNNLAKKIKYWESATKLIDGKYVADSADFYKNSTLLYLLHEQGHRLFPESGLYGELTTDIPAVISAIKFAEKDKGYDTGYVIRAILAEYIAEIVVPVDNENDLFNGYVVSSVVIINSLAKSEVVTVNPGGGLDISTSPENINRFVAELEEIDAKFYDKDEYTLNRISSAAVNSPAREIVKAFGQALSA